MSFKQGFKQETNKFGYSFEYRAGYFKALVDTCNFFEKHSDLFASNRWFSKKKMPRLLEALAEGSELLMMYGDCAVLRNTSRTEGSSCCPITEQTRRWTDEWKNEHDCRNIGRYTQDIGCRLRAHERRGVSLYRMY